MARKESIHSAVAPPLDLQTATGFPCPVAQQQQMGVRLKEATHRLAALRVRQQRAQERMIGAVPATGEPSPEGKKRV